MATSNHPKTFADLYTSLLNNVRADSGVTATVNEAKRMINTALHDTHLTTGEKFEWAHRRATVRTRPAYTTGTVTATKGSTTLTGASTDWTGSDSFSEQNVRVGGKLVIDGSEEVYRVTAVGSGTGLTMDSPWIDATTSTGTYSYFEDEYSLASDFLRPLDLRSFDINDEIHLIGKLKFEKNFPRNKIVGKPTVAAILDLPFSGDTSRVRKVRFHKPPDATYLIPYWYITGNLAVDASGSEQVEMTSDTDEPIVPLSFRMMLVYHAAAQWFSDRMDDQQRSAMHQSRYTDMLVRALAQSEVGEDRPHLSPKMGPSRRMAKYPYRGRGRGGRHTTGSTFDELRD